MSQHALEVEEGRRFEFGANWRRFLALLNPERMEEAEKSLCRMLEVPDLKGRRFLDIGSGSGLFSLAARRLGAAVHSFDYDPQSVACTEELKRRYFAVDANWTIEAGSALDTDYMRSLGQFDVVYSWGVLHHTGDMWRGLENAAAPLARGGKLYLAIYNDQGGASRRWKRVKQAYNTLPAALKPLVLAPAFARLWGPTTLADIVRGRPFSTWRRHVQSRGMSPWRDVVDWVGGYPFEVATPEQIFDFYRQKNYSLLRLKTCGGGLGCNEYVFEKQMESQP